MTTNDDYEHPVLSALTEGLLNGLRAKVPNGPRGLHQSMKTMTKDEVRAFRREAITIALAVFKRWKEGQQKDPAQADLRLCHAWRLASLPLESPHEDVNHTPYSYGAYLFLSEYFDNQGDHRKMEATLLAAAEVVGISNYDAYESVERLINETDAFISKMLKRSGEAR